MASAACTRPLRADARRNRARVLAAAREAFAVEGGDAQMDDIARRAGVGVGTLYRHFPTKAVLIDALAGDHFAAMTAEARRMLAEVADPWDAFAGFLTIAARRAATDRSVPEIMAAARAAPAMPAELAELQAAGGELIRHAQAAGALREDVEVADIPMLLCAIGRGAGPDAGCPSGSWERLLAIFLAGVCTLDRVRDPLPPNAPRAAG